MTKLTQDHRAWHTTLKIIPGLTGTATHELGIEVYRAHPDAGNGVCARCGRRHPCPSRHHAAGLIASAGDDPRRYDAPLTHHAYSRPTPAPGDRWRAGDPASQAMLPLQPPDPAG